MPAAYVFRVRFRPDAPRVRLDPPEFETVLRIPAAEPPVPDAEREADVEADRRRRGPVDWLFFRDNLWRGEVNDESYFRETATDLLGVDVVAISFSELRTDDAYLTRLRAAIEADLGAFNADDADETLHKYLGSSIHVVDADAV
jgi:hypothetical protein